MDAVLDGRSHQDDAACIARWALHWNHDLATLASKSRAEEELSL